MSEEATPTTPPPPQAPPPDDDGAGDAWRRIRALWHRRPRLELPEPHDEDDDEAIAHRKVADRKAIVVLLATPVLLTILWYYGRMPFFRKVIAPRFFAGVEPQTVDLIGYYYLAAVSVITRLLIPMGIIIFVFRERLRDFGFRVRGTAKLGRIYAALLCFMLPILFYVSSLPGYQLKYPMYRYAGESLQALLLYELSYFFVFLSGEAFWRGFMVHALAPRFGLYGLAIMSIPYAMIHFGKPFSESMGAIITGLVLGYLSLKHRSFWLGVALHATIGVTMDLLCLWRKGAFG